MVSTAVKSYDITDEGSPGTWRRQTEADDILTRSTFKCLVKLPDIETIVYPDICSFLDEQSPHQGSTPLQSSHLQWSCALWIIRGLALLNEAGISRLDLENDEEKVKFYRRIRALGMLIYSNGPWVGYEVDGIKIIDYEHGL
ncbi:hypothetical protein CPB85DRAFT_1420400 [Mucidula mucida]|nr:hypothetical protein CPB85DRAFT_1420400 [Mucidula mucida]